MEGRDALRQHIASFERIWRGGYFAADPLRRDSSPYGLFGFLGVHHAVYLTCIRPYVDMRTVALEIGPGRGAWSRALLGARELWCLDALSAEHNGFWEYVGRHDHVHYHKVEDFSCDVVPPGRINYVFSYDALCHVPLEGIEAYAESLYERVAPNTNFFWMVADIEKYERFVDEAVSVGPALTTEIGRTLPRRLVEAAVTRVEARQLAAYRKHLALQEGPEGNWWYWSGADAVAEILERIGYMVLDHDVGADPRNPILHFRR